jgi:hypothetical protein
VLVNRPICQNCGERLRPDRLLWLELNSRTNTYHTDDVPAEDSQGAFTFGSACARSVIRNGGRLTR